MIVTLAVKMDLAPVPRVEIVMEDSTPVDGGGAGRETVPALDGGGAAAPSAAVDGGTASMRVVEVPEGTDRVTLFRRSQNRTMKSRGSVDRVFTGSLGVQDLEAGHDVISAYELECWNGDESLGSVSLGSVELPWVGDPDAVLVQQPLNPRLNFVGLNLSGSWPTVTREAAGETVLVEGASYPTLVGYGPRQGLKGVSLDFGVESREQAEAVWRTLGDEENPQLPVWLIRAHQANLPRVFFCHVKSLAELEATDDSEWSRFQAVVDEIEPPAPALVIPTLSYADLAAVFETYSEMKAALPTYSQMATAWQYAGAAGYNREGVGT